MRNRIFAIVCTVASIIGIVLLYSGVKNYKKDQAEISSVYAEFSKKLSALESEKNELEESIAELESKVTEISTKASVSILLCGMKEEIYTYAFPKMEEYGIKGTIVVTGDRLPGSMGILTDSQILEMVNAGWKLIPGWTEGDGDNGITSSSQWISVYGYSFEGVVFINEADFTEERASMFSAAGCNTIIVDAVGADVSAVYNDTIGEIWKTSSIGYNINGPKKILNNALDIGGSVIFTVGFEEENELYDDTTLSSMFEYLKTYENNGSLIITDVAAVRQYRTGIDNDRSSASHAIAEEVAAKRLLIDSINANIEALYNEYQNR